MPPFLGPSRTGLPGLLVFMTGSVGASSASATTALQALVEFMGLPFNDALRDARSKTVDGFKQKREPADWERIFRHPRTVQLAQELGYDLADARSSEIEDELKERYEPRGLKERVRGKWHGLKRRLGKVRRLVRR